MRRKIIATLLGLLPLALQAQLFSTPQPMMYRSVLDLEHPGVKVKAVRTARYIPGSKFPTSWDQKSEERHYDTAGRLTLWRRYDGFNGVVLIEKTITYTPQGDRLEERTWRNETKKADVMRFKNTYDAQGRFQGAVITDEAGKEAGSVKLLPTGGRVTVMSIGPAGQKLSIEHDAKGRMVHSVDEMTRSEERFQYDAFGEVSQIERTRAGKTTTIQYKTTRDPENRITVQEEILPEGKRVMFFEYDKHGNLIARKWDPARAAESYGYNAELQITDIMQYSQEGQPREVTAVFTERYR